MKPAPLRYLIFCEKCGHPKQIYGYVLERYWTQKGYKGEYCMNCNHLNVLPNSLRKLVPDLVETENRKSHIDKRVKRVKSKKGSRLS